MSTLRACAIAVGTILVAPMFYYIAYQVLLRVQATELMWFLFWVYVPLDLFVSLIIRASTAMEWEK